MPFGDPVLPGELRSDVVVLDGSVYVRVKGELDLATSPDLWKACQGLDGGLRPGQSVVVDLGGLEFLDAAGLGTLVRLRNRLRAAGVELSIVAPSARIRRVFECAGLCPLIEAGGADEDDTRAVR